ncbi:MAG TPA: hypothetical protein VEJ87_07100 [Acidimicrobiales bacterium]|nr:hypothetical protein [Acidimicrobiales bacterium]
MKVSEAKAEAESATDVAEPEPAVVEPAVVEPAAVAPAAGGAAVGGAGVRELAGVAEVAVVSGVSEVARAVGELTVGALPGVRSSVVPASARRRPAHPVRS